MLVKKLPSESYLEAAKHMFMDSSLPLIGEERLNYQIISGGCPRTVFIKADRLCKRDGFAAETTIAPCAVCWGAEYNGEEPTPTAYKYTCDVCWGAEYNGEEPTPTAYKYTCDVCWGAEYNGEEPTSTAYKYMRMCQARCDY